MNTPIQIDRKTRRCRLYRRIFLVASALTVIGFIFWPLELDIYFGQDGTRLWVWNDEPAVSTETANFWHYYSFQPLLYLAALLAVISVLLYRYERRRDA